MLFEELGQIAPILSFGTLVHHAQLLASQYAVRANVAFGHADAIRVDVTSAIVVRRADRWGISADLAELIVAAERSDRSQ